MEQLLKAPLNGIAMEFGYYPKPCDIATSRFSVQTLPDHESSVASVTGDPDVLKDWIYPGAQQQRDFMSGTFARCRTTPGSSACPRPMS